MASKTSAIRLKATQRRAWVLDKRLEGYSYRRIAELAVTHFPPGFLPKSYNERKAWADVDAAMRETVRKKEELATQAIFLDLRRLDRMQLSLWTKALDGDIQAQTTILRIMERRSRLLGMDAPTKIAPTTPEGNQEWSPYADMSDEELRSELDRLNTGPLEAQPPST